MSAGRLWDFLVSVTGAVSIRVKIMGIVVSLIALFGLGVTWQMRITLTPQLAYQLEMLGQSIASDLSARSADLILTNNAYALYELVKDALEKNEDVRYAFILDSSDNVLVSTFGRSFPDGLANANKVSTGQKSSIEILDTEDGIIRDIAVPIFEGRAGTAHIGMSEVRLQGAIRTMTERLLLTTAAVSLLGLILGYFLTDLVVRPITLLVGLTKAVARGDLDQKISLKTRDELGQLASSFNAMTLDLVELNRQRDASNRALVERNENLSMLWEQLSQKEEMRIQLLGKVISAQEDERKRIARELHDETSQSLTSVMVGLKLLESAKDLSAVAEKAAELRSLAANALDEVHHLALELRPSALDDAGLVAALRRYIRDYSTKHQTAVDFQYMGLKDLRLAAGVETALYRIIQEALTNIAKHSQATYASVLLEYREGTVKVIVEDNGVGFDADRLLGSGASEEGLGLFGMRERASLIGANLTIESQPGGGTTVYVELPEIMPVIEGV